ncbi:MAG: hypothetical protein JXA25_16805 [Anaerolineales bacterium]|nr:hypothetical protein [Anaerolineales bacterium]
MSKAHPFVLAVDVGTSALKIVLYSREGRSIAAAVERYGYLAPAPGQAEADPETWWDALMRAAAQLHESGFDLSSLSFIAVTGQMHTAVLLDEKVNVIAPTILWLDRRASAETAELQKTLGLPPYQLNSTYTLPRLLWLYRHLPEVIKKVRHILWPKDYLRYRLTGEIITDRTEAGGAALLNWETLDWAKDRLKLAGLSPSVLPPFGDPAEPGGTLTSKAAEQLNLPAGLPVLIGTGDVLALVTAAPPKPGRVTCSLGSSSMVFYPMTGEKDYSDPQGRIYEYPLLPYPLLGGVSSTTGASLKWAIQTMFDKNAVYETVINETLQTEPGSDGLVFLPFLSGERSPFWSDTLSGGFYGLRLSHTRSHMVRAVLEGVAFSLRYLLDIYRELGVPVDEIALAGGGIETPGWPQIFANICRMPVTIYAGQETVTHGLYAYACLADGESSFQEALSRTFLEPVQIAPDEQWGELYDKSYLQYSALTNFASQNLAEKC